MTIALEYEYIIICLALGLTKVKISNRVACIRYGTYVNRLQCPAEFACHPSINKPRGRSNHSSGVLDRHPFLHHLGTLREGQSVLIQLAAGGVGIAAIHFVNIESAMRVIRVRENNKTMEGADQLNNIRRF